MASVSETLTPDLTTVTELVVIFNIRLSLFRPPTVKNIFKDTKNLQI